MGEGVNFLGRNSLHSDFRFLKMRDESENLTLSKIKMFHIS